MGNIYIDRYFNTLYIVFLLNKIVQGTLRILS